MIKASRKLIINSHNTGRLFRQTLVVLAGAATVMGLAAAPAKAGRVAAAGSAGAAQTAPVRNSVSAGYAAGNIFGPVTLRTSSRWRFRYASATAVLPWPDAPLNSSGDTINKIDRSTGFAVHLATKTQTIVIRTAWNDFAGAWILQVVQEYAPAVGGGTGYSNMNAAMPFPGGAEARFDLFYNREQGRVHWSAYQNGKRTGSGSFRAWTAKSSGGGPFREAFAGTDFSASAYTSAFSSFTRPADDARLFAVSAVYYTTYRGTKGTVIGPWPYTQLQLGTRSGGIDANAPVLRRNGHNFRVWARA